MTEHGNFQSPVYYLNLNNKLVKTAINFRLFTSYMQATVTTIMTVFYLMVSAQLFHYSFSVREIYSAPDSFREYLFFV